MSIRTVPDENIPPGVRRYLWPTELSAIAVRKHPVVFVPHGCLLAAILVLIGLDAVAVITRNALLLGLLILLFIALCLYTAHRVLVWFDTYFTLTPTRIILIGWRRRREVVSISMADADDMTFHRPPLGRLFGYGSFRIRAPEGGRRARKVGYLPYPEQLYLEVCGVIFPDPQSDA